jgi:hypothetical protein
MPLFERGKKPLSTDEDIIEDIIEKRHSRLINAYPHYELGYMRQVEQEWLRFYYNDYDSLAFEGLYSLLKKRIKDMAKAYERKWKNKLRLSRHEFESKFWEVAWNVSRNYNTMGMDFLLYEYIKKAIESRAIDILRKEGRTEQGRFENDVDSYDQLTEFRDYPALINIEKDITDGYLVRQILSNVALTDKEREVIKAFHRHPTQSYRDLAKATGYTHPEQVKRVITRIQKKINDYKEDYYKTIKAYPPYASPTKRGNQH